MGSGKSTLSKALLGEVPLIRGDVIYSEFLSSTGFCDQIPFLPNATIQDIIVGCSSGDFDRAYYNEAVQATALQADFESLGKGDQTLAGTSGAALSGGQRHRIAIARVLYARSRVAIFDDVFSGLDQNTENHIFHEVFGAKGILKRRGTTVVLCTHAVRHLPAADHIIALSSDGKVIADLRANEKYIQSLETETSEESGRQNPRIKEMEKGFSKSNLVKAQEPKNARQRQLGDPTVYHYYFSLIGFVFMIPFLIFACSFGFLYNFSTSMYIDLSDDRRLTFH